MDANRALAKRLEKLEAEVAELKAPPRQSLFKKPAARAPGPAQAVVAAAAADAFDRSLAPLPPPAPPKPPSPPGIAGYAVVYFLVPVAMLLAGHYLIVMKFDLNPLYLRGASILIPLPFGASLYHRTGPKFLPALVRGVLGGLVAVSGMLAVVGLIDDVPIVPATVLEWRETAEYSLSIALAFLLGALLCQGWKLLRRTVDAHIDQEVAQAMAMGLVSDMAKYIAIRAGLSDGHSNIGLRIQSIEKLLSMAMTSATAAGSIYAGVKAFL